MNSARTVSVVIPSLYSIHTDHTVKSVLDKEYDVKIIIVGLDKHNLIPTWLSQRIPNLILFCTFVCVMFETIAFFIKHRRVLRYLYAILGIVWFKMVLNAGIAHSGKHSKGI